jgi:hypothetical protein
LQTLGSRVSFLFAMRVLLSSDFVFFSSRASHLLAVKYLKIEPGILDDKDDTE